MLIANEDITDLTKFEEIVSIIENKLKLKFIEDWHSNSVSK